VIRKPITYWLTRDTDANGELDPMVDVWWSIPVRERITSDGTIAWFDRSPTGIDTRHSRVPIEAVRRWGHTVPTTDLECVRINTVSDIPAGKI